MEMEYTKYEIARIIAARALQLSMNAPVLLKIPKETLEAIRWDVIKIAEMEFNEGILPITIKRPKPLKQQLISWEKEVVEEEIDKEVSPEEIEKEEKEAVEETVGEMLETVEAEETETEAVSESVEEGYEEE